MGEPIRLWDKFGIAHTFYSPSIVAGLLAQGYTTEVPTVTVVFDTPKAQSEWLDKVAHLEPLEPTGPPLTPDDTHHDLPAVPKRKGKRERGDGGVL